MRRVVVTGIGIVSSIGNNQEEVLQSLRDGRSGISFSQEYSDLGFRSHLHGAPKVDLDEAVDRKLRRFMGDGAAYNYLAMKEAVDDSGLAEDDISNVRTGMVMGSGGASTSNIVLASKILEERGARKVGPFMVPRAMSSTNSATLSTPFKIKGMSYSISSACATSAHCIGNATEMIQWGKQDVMFAGGGEELHSSLSILFDGMGALSSKYNDTPEKASRAFDANRDGFVISGGAGVVVLEELEHARARGAKIYAEILGYGATSDGHDMVQPSGEGAVRCMNLAMDGVDQSIDYINTHGTSTPVGDTKELEVLREVFSDRNRIPYFNSTKSLTGHSQGAAGVHETIYTLLMMQNNFICASANIEELDPAAEDMPIARERMDDAQMNCVMSNSFGFGGTNACLVFGRPDA
ncbi:MAG: beta-ketoacyl-ACP synthase I [Rhodospirillaceae bacterium]|jgi:3-oxoacyl-[acyl-carrier-protein] synthase-1|nr:beta-ketoacyl-ACP synthase I [Rhodospirillales bacterium]MBT3907716.1 beta-ketoacyl-ACP synthase I [Rhodospirillaceae bacterium]MBT4700075.1 beta-ketoacyl-ACP synthase I [Rhodospirillaceae bacterium]MBT5035196.1 beta-ketoacyl-ACP synthase I [Rhodospirillaceae bacterium]MBT6220139.1 beta-ketoacyl-ACP synthase I [Rhodospirillaceae bacterium]